MNSRQHLATEIDRGNVSLRRVGGFVWSVAILVMIYGVFVSYGPLKDHGIPSYAAWMPSVAADSAMCVAIIAGPILAAFNLTAGWIGTLRWGAALTTWALQTAGPFLTDGGPDWAGVVLHSLPPLLLFLTAEGAASYTRKLGGALQDKRRELESAEQKDADRRAHLAETEAAYRTTAAELTAARSEIDSLTARLTAAGENQDAVKAELTLTVERLEGEIGSLRIALTEQADRLTAEHTEASRRLKDKHREALTAARAEAGTVSLTAYRQRTGGTPSPQPVNRPAMSDEEAVQAMIAAHADPSHEWSKNAVRGLTGSGLTRAERLIELWLTEVTGKATDERAVNQ